MIDYWLKLALRSIETLKKGADSGAFPKDNVRAALKKIRDAAAYD